MRVKVRVRATFPEVDGAFGAEHRGHADLFLVTAGGGGKGDASGLLVVRGGPGKGDRLPVLPDLADITALREGGGVRRVGARPGGETKVQIILCLAICLTLSLSGGRLRTVRV